MYALREALRQILRHPTASLATFFTALVSFALLYFLGLLLWNLEKVVQSLEKELEVAAFLKGDTNVEALLTEIQAWPEVGEVRLVPKEEALAQLVLDYPYLAEAKDLVGNPLPDTLRLRLRNPEAVRAVAERSGGFPGWKGWNTEGSSPSAWCRCSREAAWPWGCWWGFSSSTPSSA